MNYGKPVIEKILKEFRDRLNNPGNERLSETKSEENRIVYLKSRNKDINQKNNT